MSTSDRGSWTWSTGANSASTLASRYRCPQQLFRWLEIEEEIERSPMAKMSPPSIPEPVTLVLSTDQQRQLLTVCEGRTHAHAPARRVSVRRRPKPGPILEIPQLPCRRRQRMALGSDRSRPALPRSRYRQDGQNRGNESGLEGLHPHVFRHTFARRFRSNGGSEGDRMLLGGWRSRSMIDRYGKAAAADRAAEAHRAFSPLENL